MADDGRTLIVRHLPQDLEDDECTSLLKHFGASHVRYMGKKGRMKNTAFATFENQEMASAALRRLHQLEFLNTRLIVQFSVKDLARYHPSELEPVKQKQGGVVAAEKPIEEPKGKEAEKNTEKEKKRQVTERTNSLSSAWNFEYPFNPKLQYMYPAPTITILMNIANALATVPKFYVQVLHLMNKMNLPAPFGLPTCMPPVPDDTPPPLPPDQVAPPQPTEDMEYSSSEESEIESEDEAKKVSAKRLHRPSKKKSIRKKLKLQLQMDAQMQAIAGIMPRPITAAQNPTEVFDQTEHVAPKKIEFKPVQAFAPVAQPNEISQTSKPDTDVDVLNSGNNSGDKSGSQTNVEIGGFGKLAPEQKPKPAADAKDNMEFGKQDFISSAALKDGRLSEKEMKNASVFKKYESGDATSRLYIKNLAKHVTESDLHYIYGRYVDWDVEEEKLMYYIQLMKEGRMKGQAFITLPNEDKAKAALKDSNGFLLNGRPMVVQFSRSAKPKDNANTKAKN